MRVQPKVTSPTRSSREVNVREAKHTAAPARAGKRSQRSGPVLSPAPARHQPLPDRHANALGKGVEVVDRSDPKAVAHALIKCGYTEGVAQRLVTRNPELALRILSSPNPGPITLPTSLTSARTVGLVYRGMGTHPYDFNPSFAGTDYGTTQWFGDIVTAEGYAQDGSLATKPPPEGRTKNLTMILEMQVPQALVAQRAGEHANYERDVIPDDTLFVNRVGVFDYSDVEWQWVPGTIDDKVPDAKLKWYSYDEVFDDKGHVRNRPDW